MSSFSVSSSQPVKINMEDSTNRGREGWRDEELDRCCAWSSFCFFQFLQFRLFSLVRTLCSSTSSPSSYLSNIVHLMSVEYVRHSGTRQSVGQLPALMAVWSVSITESSTPWAALPIKHILAEMNGFKLTFWSNSRLVKLQQTKIKYE